MKRKLLAVICSVVMAMTMCVGVAFADTTCSITVNTTEPGHTYKAYQVFKGTLSKDKNTLSNVEWGDGVDQTKVVDGKNLKAAVQEISVGTGDNAVSFAGCDTPAKVAEKLGANQTAAGKTDNDVVDAFAKVVAKYLSSPQQTASVAPEAATASYVLSGLQPGYYIVTDDVANGSNLAESKYLVQLTNNVNMNPKADKPTVEKKVQEFNDTAGGEGVWQDAADYDGADTIKFQLKGTVPSRIADYSTYKYVFTDTLSKGLDVDLDSVKVYVTTEDSVGSTAPLSNANNACYTVSSVTTDEASGNKTFTITFTDLKKVPGVAAGANVFVQYDATFNENVAYGSAGNLNTVNLEYSNNPNGEGTGKTPDDKVIVFTFKATVDKVDKDSQPLKGAGFTLYKQTPKSDSATGEKEWTRVGDELKGQEMTKFEFKGLDSGIYKLEETTVPDGYNRAAAIEFEVRASYDALGDDPRFTELKIYKPGTDTEIAEFEIDSAKNASINITNLAGSVLPSTGGIGTTIFYVVGACLVVIAGVALVAKRRAAARRK
ncbi:isopeptide-forming domain-containing fimbrial protein [Xiamenia xianingshaonis]|uniref:Isopeptide-forming domain-containing fimbrial protein n=1 Tax=Xiamenia xianingshaonis TaxID=2682776 RepID=A0A9E6MPY7_9ACTN|nr:isopeptide-forming domain-containing fimbrial protein [Xiamenia xianingshaonis]NHM14650.1 isopeptide-forming domain-containing fimbrial protein [Xiamenia xianingshaonis]QTU84314.1 isopeptide-forming domain-containing fimbrial protein [Xiamenia xianingshaonis]